MYSYRKKKIEITDKEMVEKLKEIDEEMERAYTDRVNFALKEKGFLE